MAAVRVWSNSGYVTPMSSRQSMGNLGTCVEVIMKGDEDCSTYHTLPGVSFIKHLAPKKTIEIARKAVYLFGGINLYGFITLNLMRNQFKSDLHFKFLEDTINYINTGKRSVNIQMWMQLLSAPSKSFSKKLQAKTTYTMKSDYYRNACLTKWLAHEGGLQDLIIALYIIFGNY